MTASRGLFWRVTLPAVAALWLVVLAALALQSPADGSAASSPFTAMVALAFGAGCAQLALLGWRQRDLGIEPPPRAPAPITASANGTSPGLTHAPGNASPDVADAAALSVSASERQLLARLPGIALLAQAVREGALTDWLLLLGQRHIDASLPSTLPAADTTLAAPELLSHWLARHPHVTPTEVVTALQAPGTPSPAAPGDAGWRLLPLAPGRGVLWLPPVVAAPADAPAAPADEPHRAASERESIAYSVSHDLRAPIRVVEGFTRIVREDYGHLLDRIGNDHLDRVLGAAARMNTMIDALLALSRLTTQPLVRESVALSKMAEEVIDELRGQAPMRQVQVQVTPGLTASGDPNLLRSVLDNLLGNAWKYTARRNEGRIEFGVTRLSLLRPGITPGQDRPVYFVRDNGAGFDMRFADRLFGAFQRLHSASDFAGTGVGLASVRRILARHGGEVWAQAAVDQGACFYFTLN